MSFLSKIVGGVGKALTGGLGDMLKSGLSSLMGGSGIGQILGGLLGGQNPLSGIMNAVTGFLGKIGGMASQAGGPLAMLGGLLQNIPGLGQLSQLAQGLMSRLGGSAAVPEAGIGNLTEMFAQRQAQLLTGILGGGR